MLTLTLERKTIMIFCILCGIVGIILYFSGLFTQMHFDNVVQSIILILSGILLFIAGILRIKDA